MNCSIAPASFESISRRLRHASRRAPVLLGLALSLAWPLARAAQPDERSVQARFESRFPDAKVQSVSATPVAGLYEVAIDGHIVYTDASARYVFQGTLYDAAEKRWTSALSPCTRSPGSLCLGRAGSGRYAMHSE